MVTDSTTSPMNTVDEYSLMVRDSLPEPTLTHMTVEDAMRRVLAQDISTRFPIPLFANSAVDGFAVHYDDVFGCSPRTGPAAEET
jgi:molybdopterin molybdotransferase